MEAFLQTYGYWAIVIGTFLEGEIILVLAGLAAHQGYLSLPHVILAAFVGSLFGDQLYFLIGRWRKDVLLKRLPAWSSRLERAQRLIDRFQSLLIFGFRFIYGMRTITPFALGISRVPIWRFALFNGLGALCWASAVAMGGYLFGNAMQAVLGDVRRYEAGLFGLVAAAGGIFWVVMHRRRKRGASPPHGDTDD